MPSRFRMIDDHRQPVAAFSHFLLLSGLLSVCGVIGWPSLLLAAVPTTPEQVGEEGLRRQEERVREQQMLLQPEFDVLQPDREAISFATLPEESPCFVIHDLVLLSEDKDDFAWLRRLVRSYLPHCVGVEGLRRIASRLDARLIERGYVTSRVSLPEQNLSEGILQVQLHVGRVAELRAYKLTERGRRLEDRWLSWRGAFPLGQGEIFNLRDLEQGIEQMNRVPSQTVTAKLRPGIGPDTSVVVIERHASGWRDRLRGGLVLDNSGSAPLGRTQLSAHLAWDNPLGYNDMLNLSFNTNVEQRTADNHSESRGIIYSVPWGYNTFTLSRNDNDYAQIVQGTTARFLSSGNSETEALQWHRTLWRTASLKLGAYASLSTRRARSYLDDVELLVQRRRTTHFELGVTHKQLLRSASIEFELGYRRGVPWRAAQEDLPSATEGGLTLRPRILRWSAQFDRSLQLWRRAMQYSLSVRGQYTDDTTLSIDQFSIGNRYSVRGFDGDAVLLAERGFAVRNDALIPVRLIKAWHTHVLVGVDFGWVGGRSGALLPGDTLAGLAAGLRGGVKSLQFDLILATPLYSPDAFESRRWNPYVSVSYGF